MQSLPRSICTHPSSSITTHAQFLPHGTSELHGEADRGRGFRGFRPLSEQKQRFLPRTAILLCPKLNAKNVERSLLAIIVMRKGKKGLAISPRLAMLLSSSPQLRS